MKIKEWNSWQKLKKLFGGIPGIRLDKKSFQYLKISLQVIAYLLILVSFWESIKLPFWGINNSQRLLLVAGVVGVLIKAAIDPKSVIGKLENPKLILFSGLILWSVISANMAVEARRTINELIIMLGGYVLFLFFLLVKSSNLSKWIRWWLILCLGVYGIEVIMVIFPDGWSEIVGAIFGDGTRDWYLMEYLRGRMVPMGGIYMMFLLPLIRIFGVKSKNGRTLSIAMFVVGLTAILASNYRSMVVAMVIGLAAAGYGLILRFGMNTKWLLLCFVITGLGIRASIWDRLLLKDVSDRTTINTRIEYIEDAWRIVKERPLTGVGVGNFTALVKPMMIVSDGRLDIKEMPGHTHNQLLSWLVETGFVGAGLFVGLTVWFAVDDYSLWRKRKMGIERFVLTLVCWVYVIGSMLDAYPSYGFYTFWLIRGILEAQNEKA